MRLSDGGVPKCNFKLSGILSKSMLNAAEEGGGGRCGNKNVKIHAHAVKASDSLLTNFHISAFAEWLKYVHSVA